MQQTGGRLIRELNRHAEVVMEAVPQNMADDAATAAADLEKARKAAMAEPRALDAGAAAAGYEDQHQRGGSGLEDLRATPEDGFSVLTIQVRCQAAGQPHQQREQMLRLTQVRLVWFCAACCQRYCTSVQAFM